jgi:glycosyltransferase involved in cell wall biosynthesis
LPKRVLIDALAARHGGTAYAAVQLARHLALNPQVSRVSVITRPGSIVDQGLAKAPEVTRIRPSAPPRIELVQRAVWEAALLPRLASRERSTTVISMSGMLPRLPRVRVLCLLFNPVMYEHATPANALRRWAVRRTAREGTMVAAPSGYMAGLVSASIGRECAVLPLGVDHSVFQPDPDGSHGSEILCVADFYSHKRHDVVLDAWQRLAPPRPLLRLVGNPAVDHSTYAGVCARVEKLPDVVVEHGLSLDQLVSTYRRARVFVLASQRESFCMPLAESMACGVPAVVRDTPSLRETGGPGASYVATDEPEAWAAALGRLLGDEMAHGRARQDAQAAASRFSWERMASEVASLL